MVEERAEVRVGDGRCVLLRRADGVLSYFYYVQSTEEYEAKLAERAQRGSESEEQVIIF